MSLAIETDPKTLTSLPFTPSVDHTDLTSELLEPPNELPWYLLDLVHEAPDVQKDKVFDGLLNFPKPISRTLFRFKRSGIEGGISGYNEEVRVADIDNANSGNSLSINRKYTSKTESIKGKTSFLPFQPGGIVTKVQQGNAPNDEATYLHKSEYGLFDVPQGFTRGLDLGNNSVADEDILAELPSQIEELHLDESNSIDEYSVGDHIQAEEKVATDKIPFDSKEIDGIVSMDYSAMKSNLKHEKEVKRNWAHVVDLDHKIENFNELVPNMAREWPFELDTFQKEAVYHLEQGDSVFVAAHTSAGKTVVAEYAIAMATRNMTKAIYTSPIKALSNQKFRDFKEDFKDVDVGLITGDVQINPEGNCLIMTTEVLRSMLYRGADLIRDVEFVIFDEVHYVNDAERGVVWEEVIIMLPDHVKYVLLSATVPNTFEFANWVGRTKQKDIYVISTPKRPVPLEIFISAKDLMFKVIDSQRKFQEGEFKKHVDLLESTGKNKDPPKASMGSGSRGGPGGAARGGNRGRGGPARGGNRGGQSGGGAARGNLLKKNYGLFNSDGPNKNTWINLVQQLKKQDLLPAVAFIFSKKKCEDYADTLRSVDFCNAREKSEIHMFVDRAVSRLKKEDRELPQIVKIRDMLSRGIAVHHGGLLPIVKECIEILFAKTLVKVLFATETFAMGLNLPTRTVVFGNLRKHDGTNFRNLLPGEFTQMSGRAGRRGLDKIGTVIVMSYNNALSATDFKDVTLGAPTKLLSQFRLTYNMILNLLRIEALRVEEMIKHSFSENSAQVLMPENKKKVDVLTKELVTVKISQSEDYPLEELVDTFSQVEEYEQIYREIIAEVQEVPTLRNQVFKTGRMICYRNNNDVIRVGFVVRTVDSKGLMALTFDHGSKFDREISELPYIPISDYLREHFPKIKFGEKLRVESVPYANIHFVCKYALKANVKDILNNKAEAIAEAKLQILIIVQLIYKWEEVSFSYVSQLAFFELNTKRQQMLESLNESNVLVHPDFKKQYSELRNQKRIETEIDTLQKALSDENLELLPDYEQRLDVLESLGFIDHQHNVVLKGRVACEVNSGWELVITELVLDNFLGDFEATEIVALLSCFVYEGRTNDPEPACITPRLEKGKERIQELAKKMITVFSEKKVLLTTDEEEFCERKRFALVNVVYEWARGMSFKEIMLITTEAEGTIVRVITRLDEICREVKNAALIVGDSSLHAKMSEAQEKIKRDIVFCASLYL